MCYYKWFDYWSLLHFLNLYTKEIILSAFHCLGSCYWLTFPHQYLSRNSHKANSPVFFCCLLLSFHITTKLCTGFYLKLAPFSTLPFRLLMCVMLSWEGHSFQLLQLAFALYEANFMPAIYIFRALSQLTLHQLNIPTRIISERF